MKSKKNWASYIWHYGLQYESVGNVVYNSLVIIQFASHCKILSSSQISSAFFWSRKIEISFTTKEESYGNFFLKCINVGNKNFSVQKDAQVLRPHVPVYIKQLCTHASVGTRYWKTTWIFTKSTNFNCAEFTILCS